MKKEIFRAAVSVLLIAALAFLSAPSAFSETSQAHLPLHFDSRGKFRILNISDIQDEEVLDARVKQFIRRAVTDTCPDLIVLTGDNIYGTRIKKTANTRTAIAQFMDIFEALGVPVALVFGNHDDEGSAWSKEQQMAFYRTYSVCVANDDNSSLSGCGTYNLPIYSYADRDKTAFNLWMFDTGSDAQSGSSWDNMRQDQLDWYVSQSNALKAANGGEWVPSIAFQHIVVKEIYDALKPVSSGTQGAVKHVYYSGYYVLPDTASPGSVLGESPCPSKYGDEFAVLKSQGDVRAIVCGHDHNNQFIVPHQGIDLICTTGVEYGVYTDNALRQELRGARVIDIDEATGTYTTFMVKNRSYTLSPEYYVRQENKYIKDIALCCVPQNGGALEDARSLAYSRMAQAVDAVHNNGVVLPTDLNDGSTTDLSDDNHHVIYAGYTLTDDPSEAVRALGIFVNSSGNSASQYHGSVIDGHTYVLCNYGSHLVPDTDGAVSMNAGTRCNTQKISDNSMYLYATYDEDAGEPLTEMMIVSLQSAINMSGYSGYDLVMPIAAGDSSFLGNTSFADLNKYAAGTYVYALTRSGGNAVLRTELNSSAVRGAYVSAQKRLQEPAELYTASSRSALQSEAEWVQSHILQDLDSDNLTETLTQETLDAHATALQNCIAALRPRQNTVELFANGGACSVTQLTVYDGEAFGALPTPVYGQYSFLGWFTQREGGTKVTEHTVYTAGQYPVLYAHWQGITPPNDLQSATISDQIALHLLLDLHARGKSPEDVCITLDGSPYTAQGELLNDGSDLYRFTVVMAPSAIAQDIDVTFNGSRETLRTSVMTYCELLYDAAYNAPEKVQNLARAILEYGQAAHDVFDSDTLTWIADLSGMDRTSVLSAETVLADGTGLVGSASFMALTQPEYRFYMPDVSASDACAYNQPGGITAAYVGENAPTDAITARFVRKAADGGDCILLEVTGVSAEHMDKTIEIAISGLGSITFNGNVFAKAMAQTAEYRDLGAALYNYGVAAKACFCA